jgi:hypothetical protein
VQRICDRKLGSKWWPQREEEQEGEMKGRSGSKELERE